MELFSFDRAYLERLRAGDTATEEHFVSYFSELLSIKLRARRLGPDLVQELRQETFRRVLTALRAEGGIRQEERFGAFVNSVCTNVLREHYRDSARGDARVRDPLDAPDKTMDLESFLVTEETRRLAREIVAELPPKDARLLRAIFLEEKDKSSVCREFGVDQDYLRVLLFRAKERFKARYRERQALAFEAVVKKAQK